MMPEEIGTNSNNKIDRLARMHRDHRVTRKLALRRLAPAEERVRADRFAAGGVRFER